MTSFEKARRMFARALWKAGAVSIPSPGLPLRFNLHARESPELGPLTPEVVKLVASLMRGSWLVKRVSVDAVACVQHTGNPFAKALAEFAGKPLVMLQRRESNEERDILPALTGIVPPSVKTALLADGILAEGGSKVLTIEYLADQGITVTHVAVAIDCEKGGRERIAEWGAGLSPVLTVTEFFAFCVGDSEFPSGDRARLLAHQQTLTSRAIQTA